VIALNSEVQNILIIGNGFASAECIKALRDNGYNGKISLLNDNHWSVFNPMLITYYLADKISFDGLFPFGRGQDFYEKYGVGVYFDSPAIAIDLEDKVVFTQSSKVHKYDKCLIATGARPILPKISGINSDRVFTIRKAEDAIRIKNALRGNPKKALIVGASLIGIKVAEVFYNRGIEVYLSDIAKHIFPLNAHPECAKIIEERLKRRGIQLLFGTEMEKLQETKIGIKTYFKDKSMIETDLVVICIGVKANTEFIDKKKVAVDRGILIDEYTKTNLKDIYAAGDVAQGKTLIRERFQIIGLLSNARYQGRTAGENMAGKIVPLPKTIPHNIAHFMGIDFVSIGDVSCYERMEMESNGERLIMLFWSDKFLTGVNLLDYYEESGTFKHALIRGLVQKKEVIIDKASLIQTQWIKNLIREVVIR